MTAFQAVDGSSILPARIMKKYNCLDGRIVKSGEAHIKLNDLGLLRGYAAFDFIKVLGGQPLFWREHVRRFRRSANLLRLKLPVSDRELTALAQQLLLKNGLGQKDASLRLLITGGESPNGFMPTGRGRWAIIVEDAYSLPAKLFKTGGKLMTVNYARLLPFAKTTNYLLAVSLQKKKRAQGAVEILYLDQGEVLEASTSNFFAVFGRKIVTPRARVLPGITRAKVIKLARAAGYQVEERRLKWAELKLATEAFITATNKDVCPIVRIDAQLIGDGRVGPVTQTLLKNYRQAIGVLK